MPFTTGQFLHARPYLFHLTAEEHRGSLRQARQLLPAADIIIQANAQGLLSERRREHVSLSFSGTTIKLRDQKPLHAGNMLLEGGLSFGEFVAILNGRVFFWPGYSNGLPIPYGQRHYDRYAAESPLLLRVPTADLLAHNQHLQPEFCKFNSGSPRWTNGRPSPRGRQTFLDGSLANFGAASVVEVTFAGVVSLPATTQIGPTPSGPWSPL